MTLDVGMAWADLSEAQVRMSERMSGLRCILGKGRRMRGSHRSGRRINPAEDNEKQMDLFCLFGGPRFPPSISFVLAQAPVSVSVVTRRDRSSAESNLHEYRHDLRLNYNLDIFRCIHGRKTLFGYLYMASCVGSSRNRVRWETVIP
jgi:hypothetical protein